MNVKGNFKKLLSFFLKDQELFENPQGGFMRSPTSRLSACGPD